jgi:hypothetical protein
MPESPKSPDWTTPAKFLLAGWIGPAIFLLDLFKGVKDASLGDTGDGETRVPVSGIFHPLDEVGAQMHGDLPSTRRVSGMVEGLDPRL